MRQRQAHVPREILPGLVTGPLPPTAYSINTSGQIVGTYAMNSGASGTFLYTNGMMTLLPPPAGSSIGYGSAINDKGEIAGYLFVSQSYHAAKISNGIWTDLGTIKAPSPAGFSATRPMQAVTSTPCCSSRNKSR
jgi:probable HAF family extracellular repeat protein